MKHIITDWMNNVCFDSIEQEFNSFDDAEEFLCEWLQDDYEDERGEYFITEYNEKIDRIMWIGNRYVFKPDYYN